MVKALRSVRSRYLPVGAIKIRHFDLTLGTVMD
jgi:hypothetical protein